MVIRTCTGPGTAEKGGAGMKGRNGGPSPNNRELAGRVTDNKPKKRLAALEGLAGNIKALAYLAAVSPHEDAKEKAKELLFRSPDALFSLLDRMTGRAPHPWERELVRIVEASLDASGSRDAKVLKLKAWQLQNSKAFGPSGSCGAQGGSTVEFVDESPADFDEEQFAALLDSTQA